MINKYAEMKNALKIICAATEIDLDELLRDCSDFNNWVMPSRADLELEYKVEYKNHVIYDVGNVFPTLDDFLEAIDSAQITAVSPDFDSKILNRSHTRTMEELIDLVSSYRSWPKYRNEGTVKSIIDGFINDQPMKMPIILETNGYRRIMSGNTRMDIAFMMNAQPKALVIRV